MRATNSSRLAVGAAVILALYILTYLAIRQSQAEIWQQDGNTYVLFPNAAVYYLYRPLTYADAALTGMSFHIGPHR